MVKVNDEKFDANYSTVRPENIPFDDWSSIAFGVYWRWMAITLGVTVALYILTSIFFIISSIVLGIFGLVIEKSQLFFFALQMLFTLVAMIPMTWRFMKWILSIQLGDYRLILLKRDKIKAIA